MKQYRSLTALYALLLALAVLAGSVAVPLLVRPFYYAHVEAMDLPGRTGLTGEQIRACYDDVMDYCLGLRPDFAAGGLPFSAAGADHFADVRRLFLLDLGVLAGAVLLLALLAVLGRRRGAYPARILGRGPGFWAAAGLGGTFLAVGGLAALDFDRAFVIFHAIFFPGKDNWIFDWRYDPVIVLLPQDFFRNCAILVLALVLFWCGALVLCDLFAGKKRPTA